MNQNPFETTKVVNLGRFIKMRQELQVFLRQFGIKRFKGVGTTNKAMIMNDIDLAVESDLNRDQMYDLIVQKMGKDYVKKSGSAMISLVYQEYHVDLFVGNIRYIDWARCAPSNRQGRGFIKGIFRNLMLNAVLRVISSKMFETNEFDRKRYVLDFDEGLYLVQQTKRGKTITLKEWKTTNKEFVSNVPDDIVKLIFNDSKKARYIRSFEELMSHLRKASGTKDHVQEICSTFMEDVLKLDPESKAFSGHRDEVLELIEEVMYEMV